MPVLRNVVLQVSQCLCNVLCCSEARGVVSSLPGELKASHTDSEALFSSSSYIPLDDDV